MTPRSKRTKLKRLNNQFKKHNGNDKIQENILKKIETIENTKDKRR